MGKGVVVIGFIGSILAIAGVFTPWVTASASATIPMVGEASFSTSMTGWNIAKGELRASMTIQEETRELTMPTGESESYPYIALAGGILALIGALGALPGLRKLSVLFAIGGMLVIIGAAWGFSDIETGTRTETLWGMTVTGTAGYGYGLYLCLMGGILSLVGVLGLRRKEEITFEPALLEPGFPLER